MCGHNTQDYNNVPNSLITQKVSGIYSQSFNSVFFPFFYSSLHEFCFKKS